MFDNLRQRSSQDTQEAGLAPEAEIAEETGEDSAPVAVARPAGRPAGRNPLDDLTPIQRFVLALLLFLNVSVLGCFALIALEKIALP
jgi:hypothetical protein